MGNYFIPSHNISRFMHLIAMLFVKKISGREMRIGDIKFHFKN
jgi:hypothetical protein